jgi:hypothetical protein
LVHDNHITGNFDFVNGQGIRPAVAVTSNRCMYAKQPAWGTSDGTSVWDANITDLDDATGDWPTLNSTKQHFVEGHTAIAFKLNVAGDRTGTANPTSAAVEGTLVDTTKAWTAHQWKGYSVHKITTGTPYGSIILDNTATTLTYYAAHAQSGAAPILLFNAGDQYQIHKVLSVMDGSGMGKTDLIIGTPPLNYAVTPHAAAYSHTTIEPVMQWNNMQDSPSSHVLVMSIGLGPDCQFQHVGTHSFDVGAGFPADTTPTAVSQKYDASLNGVAYTGTFTYPHPLVSGAPTPTSSATPRSEQHLQKKKKNSKKLKRRNWPKKIGE